MLIPDGENNPSSFKPHLSVVIVTYNNADTIAACLESLREHLVCTYEVLVVDNSPDKTTRNRITNFQTSHPDFPLTCIEPGKNLGFGAGCNLGAKSASGRYLLFLNPDAQLRNDLVSIFDRFEETHSNAGIMGPKILREDGKVERTCRNFPNLFRIFFDATGLDRVFGIYRLLWFDHQKARLVPQLMGACLYLSAAFFEELKGFDESFFVYFEEVDLCKRSLEHGRENWFVPEATIMHLAGVSCESEGAAASMIVQLRKSRVLYFRKHFGVVQTFFLAMLNMLEGVGKSLVFALFWRVTKTPGYAKKMKGFWKVAQCFGCWR